MATGRKSAVRKQRLCRTPITFLLTFFAALGVLPLSTAALAEGKMQPDRAGQPRLSKVSPDGRHWNVIFIMTDDLAQWAVGAYGNRDVVTPNLDGLARDGALFENAFAASPVCTPSRVSFLTGLYPSQVGLTDVEDYMPDGTQSGGLPRGVPSWPRVLKDHGYATGLIGKWHLGHDIAWHHPRHYGIDYFYGFIRGSSTPMNPSLYRDGVVEEVPGSLTDILTDDAMRFVERHRAERFALMLHFRAPHTPYGPVPTVDSDAVRDVDPEIWKSQEMEFDYIQDGAKPWPEGRAQTDAYVKRRMQAYYASIHSVDRNVGRLLESLEELDIADRTIVIFTSDNGYFVGQRGLREKGAAIPVRGISPIWAAEESAWLNMLEPAVQLPFLVRWPGVVKPGARIDAMIANVDVPVSILNMLDVPAPDSWPQNGRDFTPLLRGETGQERDAVFGQYSLTSWSHGQSIRMIRTDRWKLVRGYFAHGGVGELYDLENDPDELENLYYPPRLDQAAFYRTVDLDSAIAPHPHKAIRDELEQRLIDWQKSIDDPILVLDQMWRTMVQNARDRWSDHQAEQE